MDRVTIYTDGACSYNPGPGGWGCVLIYGSHRKEASGSAENTSIIVEAAEELIRKHHPKLMYVIPTFQNPTGRTMPYEVRKACLRIAEKYGLKGVHLNSRNPQPPENFSGTVSKSLHSASEVIQEKDNFDYVSLSPIFDSVSKKGYNSKFTLEELKNLKNQGVIDEKVYALGGVTRETLPLVKNLGFGGAMILGAAWREQSFENLVRNT